jgi:hypothetical protein
MSNVVRYPQTGSQQLIARLVKAGYLRPALRNDADAITTAIARLKEDSKRRRRRRGPEGRLNPGIGRHLLSSVCGRCGAPSVRRGAVMPWKRWRPEGSLGSSGLVQLPDKNR